MPPGESEDGQHTASSNDHYQCGQGECPENIDPRGHVGRLPVGEKFLGGGAAPPPRCASVGLTIGRHLRAPIEAVDPKNSESAVIRWRPLHVRNRSAARRFSMFSRKRELPIWVVAAAAVSVPLATLGWSAVASAQPGSIPVTITVTPSANPSSFGQDVTYTATLVTSDSGSLVIPDSIEFQDSGNDIDGCSSQPLSGTSTVGTYTATCDESASQLSVGVHSITAFFGGDSTYNSGSGSLNQSVGKGTTTTSITSPASGASVPYGNEGQNSLNVLVSAAAGANLSPSNSVNFYAGAPGPETLLCTAFLNGMGSGKSDGSCNLNYNQLEAGHYSLTAVYGGDNTFLASSSTPQAFNVTQITTRMNVFPVPGYAFYGAESGNFFIVGAGGGGGGNPTGFFTITAGGISLIAPNSCSASNGGGNPCFIDSATALPASTTPYAVTVSYPGDGNFTPASTTVPLLVFPATTSTQLTVSPSSATYGKEGTVTISASVISGTTGAPTGPVDVQSGGSTVCAISDLRATGRNTGSGELPSARQCPVAVWRLCAHRQLPGRRQFPEFSLLGTDPGHRQPGLLAGGIQWGSLPIRHLTVFWLNGRSELERSYRWYCLDA